jgi:hypothetical protein
MKLKTVQTQYQPQCWYFPNNNIHAIKLHFRIKFDKKMFNWLYIWNAHYFTQKRKVPGNYSFNRNRRSKMIPRDYTGIILSDIFLYRDGIFYLCNLKVKLLILNEYYYCSITIL